MPKAILTDIEGTTSSLSFVKDVLFPYARANLGAFIRAHIDDPAVKRELAAVSQIAGRSLDAAAAVDQLVQWIDEDKKITPLKSLQGMVWERGYAEGDFTGHLYPDAYRQLRTWHEDGIGLYIFSSGSVKAQKLLFAHTDYGDLTPFFLGYFDTTTGAKREAQAYEQIAREIGLPPGDILFLSDIEEELDAAREAGMPTTKLVRDVSAPATSRHPVVRTFDEITV